MSVEFRKALRETRFLDPMSGFAENKRTTEIRIDPLTGRTARVLEWPGRLPSKPDLTTLVEKSLQIGCPFCPERVEAITPMFPPDLLPEPRIKVGDAIVVCNMFPYDAYSAVCVMTSRHFIAIDEFDEELLVDALLASQSYVRMVAGRDATARYISINWNYMPPSGGTLIHPHLQVIVGDTPSNYHREIIECSRRYYETNSANYWADLIDAERRLGERYVASTGPVHWLVPFAPKGIIDVMAVFEERASVLDLERDDWSAFADGLASVMRYLGSLNFHSLNMSLISGLRGEDALWTTAHVVPRFSIFEAIGTSDINYFEALHEEVLTRVRPEDVGRDLQPFFG
ncbi:MAG: hypothetical protein ACUVX1_18275 [Chloroflexota bacterium]